MPGPKFRVRADQCGPSKKLKPWVPDRTLVGTGHKVFIPGPAMALDMKRFGSGSGSSASAAKVGGSRKTLGRKRKRNKRKTLRKMRA
jgi:hypothetical protein